MTAGLFADYPTWRKLLIGTGIALISFFVFTVLGAGLASYIYGIEVLSSESALYDLDDPVVIDALKLIQVIGGEVGLFIVPSFLIAWLFSGRMSDYLSFRKVPSRSIILIILVLVASVPLVNWLVEWNSGLSLPGILEPVERWMRQAERDAEKITGAFLKTDGYGGLAVNLAVVAILPALGEEFLFRGVLQRLTTEWTGNRHAGILLAAIVFSAIHMQFFGFVPRMLLGVYFGYLLLWSGSIWLPVAAHFLNNAAAVIVAFLVETGRVTENPDELGVMEGQTGLVLISVGLTAMLLYGVYRKKGVRELMS